MIKLPCKNSLKLFQNLLEHLTLNYTIIWVSLKQKQILFSYCVIFFIIPESIDALHMLFCFKMLLLRFKRELQFDDVKRIWEVQLFVFSYFNNTLQNEFYSYYSYLSSFLFHPSLHVCLSQSLWTCPLTPDYHLFVAAGVVLSLGVAIMRECMGLDGILELISRISELDPRVTLADANEAYVKFSNASIRNSHVAEARRRLSAKNTPSKKTGK